MTSSAPYGKAEADPDPLGPGFLALLPARGFLSAFTRFQASQPLPDLHWTPWYKLHLTLRYWPQIKDEEAAEIMGALKVMQAESDIQGFHFFINSQVLYLKEISGSITGLLSENAGILKPEREEFIPHWTIARKFSSGVIPARAEYFMKLSEFRFRGPVFRLGFFRTLPGRYHRVIQRDLPI